MPLVLEAGFRMKRCFEIGSNPVIESIVMSMIICFFFLMSAFSIIYPLPVKLIFQRRIQIFSGE